LLSLSFFEYYLFALCARIRYTSIYSWFCGNASCFIYSSRHVQIIKNHFLTCYLLKKNW
jgi:hypothetical protein